MIYRIDCTNWFPLLDFVKEQLKEKNKQNKWYSDWNIYYDQANLRYLAFNDEEGLKYNLRKEKIAELEKIVNDYRENLSNTSNGNREYTLYLTQETTYDEDIENIYKALVKAVGKTEARKYRNSIQNLLDDAPYEDETICFDSWPKWVGEIAIAAMNCCGSRAQEGETCVAGFDGEVYEVTNVKDDLITVVCTRETKSHKFIEKKSGYLKKGDHIYFIDGLGEWAFMYQAKLVPFKTELAKRKKHPELEPKVKEGRSTIGLKLEELTSEEIQHEIDTFFDFGQGMSFSQSINYAATRLAYENVLKESKLKKKNK